MHGAVEILTNNGAISTGIVLDVASVDDVPQTLQQEHQMQSFRLVDARAGVDAEWLATDVDGHDAVVLWRETQNLTILEIAAAIEAARGGGN